MEIIFKGKKLLIDVEDKESLLLNSWCFDNNNYLSNRSKNINERFHRYIMKSQIQKYCEEHNISKTQCKIDHINGDVLDNRKINLRCSTHSENLLNRPKQKNNKSGYKGISIVNYKSRFIVEFRLNYKKYSKSSYCFNVCKEWVENKIIEFNLNYIPKIREYCPGTVYHVGVKINGKNYKSGFKKLEDAIKWREYIIKKYNINEERNKKACH